MSFPDFRIVDTYKSYKARERKFTTWLKEKGEKLGLLPNKGSQNLRGPDVQIKNITPVAKSIVAHGEPIPDDVRFALQDVITQRKEAKVFYIPRGQVKDDEGHAHYVRVLETVKIMFDQVRQNGSKQISKVTLPTSKEKHAAGSPNVYGTLHVEPAVSQSEMRYAGLADGDDDESDSAMPLKKAPVKKKGGKKAGKARNRNTENAVSKSKEMDDMALLDSIIQSQAQDLDYDDDTDDLYFMVYCFFKDWNIIRNYLQERWCDYQDGLLSLAAVSLITNTAFELLQRSERELLSQLPLELSSYGELSDMLFIHVGLAHVDYRAKHVNETESMYEEADWLALPQWWFLSEWIKMSPPKGIPSTLQRYIDEPLDFHPHDTEGCLSRDKRICFELFTECCLIKALKNNEGIQIPAEDELTRGVTHMLNTRQIPIWLVFAMQVHCDIRYILEADTVKSHQELKRAGQRTMSILNKYVNFSRDIDTELINPAIRTTLAEVDCWINDDCFEPFRSNIHKQQGKQESEIEPYYYLKRQPILCGLMKFRFSLTMNELGLSGCNQWGATIAAAHLYNAIRNEDPDFPEWVDMKALIFIHSTKRIFWRDHLPRHPEQYARSYERASGVGEMLAQRKQSYTNVIKPKGVYQRGIAPVSVVSAQYHERFCFAQKRPINTLPAIEKMLNDDAEREIESSISQLRLLAGPDGSTALDTINSLSLRENTQDSNHFLATQFRETHSLSNTQLLSALCTRVSQEAYALNFDYFSLHMRCTLLLRSVYAAFKSEIDAAQEEELDWTRGELPVLPHYLFEWMQDEGRRDDIVKRLRKAMEKIVVECGGEGMVDVRAVVEGDLRGTSGGDELEG